MSLEVKLLVSLASKWSTASYIRVLGGEWNERTTLNIILNNKKKKWPITKGQYHWAKIKENENDDILNVNWIRYFFQFIKHVLNETSSTHRALFPVSFSFQFLFLRFLSCIHQMESSSLFTIIIIDHFRILFSTFRFIFLFFLSFLHFHFFSYFTSIPFSFETEGRERLENAYNFMPLLSFRNVFFSFWSHFSPRDFSSFGFSVFLLPTESSPNTKNWIKHVRSIQYDKLEKSLSLRWYVKWPNKIVSFLSIMDQGISYSSTMVNDAYMNVVRMYNNITLPFENRISLVKSKFTIVCDPKSCS